MLFQLLIFMDDQVDAQKEQFTNDIRNGQQFKFNAYHLPYTFPTLFSVECVDNSSGQRYNSLYRKKGRTFLCGKTHSRGKAPPVLR